MPRPPSASPDLVSPRPGTGAELLLRTAAAAGVEACFANPGTTELGLVNAFDAVPAVRPVLCQFEGVCSGAADGWGRMRDLPALALFHLGPGLANGLANLHNARRARTPLVALVGEHATWHRDLDAPLASDIAALARPVSRFVRTSSSAGALGQDAADALAASTAAGGGVATLVVPSDCQSGEAAGAPPPVPAPAAARVAAERVSRAGAALRAGGPAAIFLGGRALRERGLLAAARAAGACGARLVSECFPARQERGAGLPPVERIPYFPERAAAALAGLSTLVLAGAPEPVAFFGYPGQPSRFVPAGCEVLTLASPEEDVEVALADLADALGAPARLPQAASRNEAPAVEEGALTPASVSALLARMQPEGAIVVDESATTGLGWFRPSAASPRHTLLTLTGGSIGMGPPLATGAALACPDRPVIDFQGDGAAMYTLQALWTQAREGLHVVTLLCNNRSYRILEVEQQRAGVRPGPRAASLTALGGPALDWVLLARGMGVPATRVEDTGALRGALARSLAAPGPHLLELMI
jgi:acetolactate synthase-1/2/3 large subunit